MRANLLSPLSDFPRNRERGWPGILAGRHVLNLGGFGSGGPCSCCGGSSPTCGYPCSVCSGIYLNYAAASITDANGTATFPLYWGGVSTRLSFTVSSWYVLTSDDPNVPNCTQASGTKTLYYRYRISCSGSNVLVEIIPDLYAGGLSGQCWRADCTGCLPTSSTPLYALTDSSLYCYPVNPVAQASVSVTPTCSAGTLTATATFASLCSGSLSPPVASASLSIPYAADGSGWCCQSINVTGCNGLPLEGALVQVYDHAGGTLLDSATTGADGVVGVQWTGSCSVYVKVSKCLFTDSTGSYTFVPQGSTTIAMTASGGTCFPGHADPKANVVFTVYDCDHVTPCVGALVTISSGAGGTTDGSGQVTLAGWPGDTISVAGCSYTGAGVFPACGAATDLYLDCPLCEITGTVTGCNGMAVDGVTINLNGSYATITDASGNYTITGVTAGSNTVQAVCSPRFNSSSSTITVTCPGTTTVNFSLSAATGYHCIGCSAIPLKDNVVLSDSYLTGSTCTLSYVAGVWTGVCTMNYPGSGGCSSGPIQMQYTLNADCSVGILYGSRGGCPSNSPVIFLSTSTTTGTNYVPTDCAASTPFQFNGTMATHSPIYPSGAVYTITE